MRNCCAANIHTHSYKRISMALYKISSQGFRLAICMGTYVHMYIFQVVHEEEQHKQET